MNIEEARPEHGSEISKIIAHHWQDNFGEHLRNKIQKYFEKDSDLIQQNFSLLVAREKNMVIGFAAFRDAPDHMVKYAATKKPAELYVLAVKTKGQGVGSALRNKRLKILKRLGYTEALLFSSESHKDSWGFHDMYAKRIAPAQAPNKETGYVWSVKL